MVRVFFFLFGFGFMVIGHNFGNYVNFIIREPECYYSIIGLTIMILSITIKGEKDIWDLFMIL